MRYLLGGSTITSALVVLSAFVIAVLVGVRIAPRREVARERGPDVGCMDVAEATGLRFGASTARSIRETRWAA